MFECIYIYIDNDEKQHCVTIYKHGLLTIIPNPDSNGINLFFLNDDVFEFTVYCRTLNVIDIKSILNICFCLTS
jgi:hypothetical protein